TFLIYDIVARVEDIKIKYIPLKDYRYDLDAMKKAVTKKTKMIFIANPDNPTGTYVTRKEVDRFMGALRKEIIVFFDEAYYDFAKDFRSYPDTLKFLRKKRRVIITRSFSKIYSLAGLRIGYGIADEGMIETMSKVKEPFNVNSLAQAGARAALRDTDFVKKTKYAVGKGKDFLYSRLDLMGIDYVPSATNFILLRVGKDAPRIYSGLLERGVIIRNMKAWGLNDCLRVTVGTMRENKRFVKTLKEIVGSRVKGQGSRGGQS
ncbi:aminotransferase class I/II-fold pyridoxal phosphate-dependent enzyme, partial [Omnitrophica bacterium]|nr:aminotransferase class I/II-fold pyridoxal phosphate-dependent enzyme [Candidatus Omnitrophota bacterium]